MNYSIAIPSYKRPLCVRDKTLKLLKDAKIPSERITIFVSTPEEAKIYREMIPADLYGKIVNAGTKGLGNTRNFIQGYYPEGHMLLELDDDIKGLYFAKDPKTLIPVGEKLNEVIETGFKLCQANGVGLWGIYPVSNAFFMKQRYTFDIKYIIGAFFGIINTHNPSTFVTLDDKEDFMRSILWYIRDKKVLRFDMICIDSAFYTEPGGMQVERTESRISASAAYLLRRFPQYCKDNSKGKKHAEIRLVDLTEKKCKTA
jgi:hypothetical protein